MPRRSRLAVLATILLAASLPAAAGDTMRCGSRIVSTGDGKDKVRSLCGEPSDVAFVGTTGRRAYPGHYPDDYPWFGPAWVELPIEVWTYNFGSSKLLRKLRFVGEELVYIETDGYGY